MTCRASIQPHSSPLSQCRPKASSFIMPVAPARSSQVHAGRCLFSSLSGRSSIFQYTAVDLSPLWRQHFSHKVPVPTTPTAFTILITFIQSYCLKQTTSYWETETVSYVYFHPLEYSSAYTKTGGPFIFKFLIFNDSLFCYKESIVDIL